MKIYISLSAIAIATTVLTTNAMANGYTLNEQSVNSASRAFAGRASVADDTTTIYGNPAGMSLLPGMQVSAGVIAIMGKAKISDTTSYFNIPNTDKHIPINGTNNGDMVPVLPLPAAYFSYQFNDKWHAGVGLYSPQGVITDYEDSFQGRYQGSISEVKVITIQPTVSYKLTDNLALGFGLTINRITGELSSKVFTGTPVDANSTLKGNDTAIGFNFGLLANITDQTKLGFTYHSKVDYTLKGDLTLDMPAPPPIGSMTAKGDVNLKVTTPDIVDLSISHDFDERFTLHGSITYTGWKKFKHIYPEIDDNFFNEPLMQAAYAKKHAEIPTLTPQQFAAGFRQAAKEQMDWKNTLGFGIAADYKYSSNLTLRAGFTYDPTPVTEIHRNVRVPVNDRIVIGIGGGYKFSDNLSMDLSYTFMKDKNSTIDRKIPNKPTYKATYKSHINLLGAQINYKF